MGVMSRKVVPACGNLCCFCPALRARSRQPVKRYKKLLTDVFPRSQDGKPNDRMIGKLCDYASKNPTRIPKITQYLEERCYKELRNGQLSLAKVVPCVYKKLLASCKEQMPFYGSSVLGIIRTLLEQTRENDMQIMGCLLLVDFLDCQVDSTYMFNIEGFIPKLCQLGQEAGGDDRGLRLRSAGLQALSSVVFYMGEHSHISMDFDDIVSVALENYEASQVASANLIQDNEGSGQQKWVEEVVNAENQVLSFQDSWKEVLSFNHASTVEIDPKMDLSKSPGYWSRVCLCNMSKLAKEATTLRRFLEPLFRKFDSDNYWSPEKGVACSVLSETQSIMEETGQKGDQLFSALIKHLDHKNVTGQPITQANIVNVATHLARNTKIQASLVTITSLGDLIRQLRKCMQNSLESSNLADDVKKWNSFLHFCIENCIIVLAKKVGDMGIILDTLAVLLESVPSTSTIARATISSIYRIAQLAALIPNVSYEKKAFPEALFHQLLLAMMHPDHGTRVGSHRVLSAVLVPSIFCPWSIPIVPFPLREFDPEGALLVALSGYCTSGTRLKMLAAKMSSDKGNDSSLAKNESEAAVKSNVHDSWQNYQEDGHMRLSSHQVDLLLSSIWAQATSPDNTPVNYEALSHTYAFTLLFSRSKNSSQMTLVRCFQLAFSLRNIALDHENYLKPSRRRSLCTLATSMLILSAIASDLPEFVSSMNAMIEKEMVDPHLRLMEDSRLATVSIESVNCNELLFGSNEDEIDSLSSLEKIEKDGKKLKEITVSYLKRKFEKLPEEKSISLMEQLLVEFSPDDTLPLGAPLFMETPYSGSSLVQREHQSFDKVTGPAILEDEESFPEVFRSHSDRKVSDSLNASDVLSVSQLIESVTETAREVASLSPTTNPVPYDQMKSQCEALVIGKQQKMSVLRSFKQQQGDSKVLPEENLDGSLPQYQCTERESQLADKENILRCDSLSSDSEQSFRLPPASPYDKFLKAAGW